MRSTLIKPDYLVLEPEGYLCGASAQSFQTQLSQSVSDQNQDAIVVNMSKVEFLDSAGLMSLLSGYRLAKELGKRLIMCSLSPSVRMVFELTRLDIALEICENLSEAESSLATI